MFKSSAFKVFSEIQCNLSLIITVKFLGFPADRVGAELDLPEFSLGLSGMVSVYDPDTDLESVDAGCPLTVLGRNFYRVVIVRGNLGMG